jgi:DNA-binding LacI/PurR family transcriptional regulator
MAERSIEVLLDLIAGRRQSTGRWDLFHPELVVRGSTARLGTQ